LQPIGPAPGLQPKQRVMPLPLPWTILHVRLAVHAAPGAFPTQLSADPHPLGRSPQMQSAAAGVADAIHSPTINSPTVHRFIILPPPGG
jgi:hypothetical protein